MCGFMFSSDVSLTRSEFEEGFKQIAYRGPDMSRIIADENGLFGFHRLAIMGREPNGMQPFTRNGYTLVCNGELYGFRKIKKQLGHKYLFVSGSDCELIIPWFMEKGLDMFKEFDAEFACVLTTPQGDIIAARDPFGIRPMFYGYALKSGKIMFASEAKALHDLCSDVFPFPCGHYYYNGTFYCYRDIAQASEFIHSDVDTIATELKIRLIDAVNKRNDADAPIGYLLSGGLDSSLVCALAAKCSKKPIQTFAIGMEKDAIDLKYAKEVADYIGSDHHEVIITSDEVLKALPQVIKILETWDITTIRASIGMYLLCKWIRHNTDIKVIFTGEISDELFGYKYTDFAPNPIEFQKEAQKRVSELFMYDVLRADRCISANGLEGRVPFGDLAFADYVMSIDPVIKMNNYHMGKYLLRHAFEGDTLPSDILFRDKAAFSDAVGHSLVDDLKAYAEKQYDEAAFKAGCAKYDYHAPYTKESLLYRDIFESYYPNRAGLIKDYWLPNQSWQGCQVSDPSARYLSNYGKSGE